MSGSYQEFLLPTDPIVGPDGKPTSSFYSFIHNIWLRSGGPQTVTSSDGSIGVTALGELVDGLQGASSVDSSVSAPPPDLTYLMETVRPDPAPFIDPQVFQAVSALLDPPAVLGGRRPYYAGMSFVGMPGAGQWIFGHIFTDTVNFPANFAGSLFRGMAAATGSTAFSIYQDGVGLGTVTVAAGGVAGTFSTSAVTFSPGSALYFVGPSPADATLANIFTTLRGFRSGV